MTSGGADTPFDDPTSAAAHCWQMLVRASRDRRSAWRTPVLATVGADGAPRARVLVLRRVDPVAGLLWLHSDKRSTKMAELGADPRLALTFYDVRRALQLRVEGAARIEVDPGVLAEAWARVPEAARRNYATAEPPGSVAGAGDPALAGDGAANFALIEIATARLEWLWLGPDRHRRGEAWPSRREGGAASWDARGLIP